MTKRPGRKKRRGALAEGADARRVPGSDVSRRSATGPGVEDGPSSSGPEPPGLTRPGPPANPLLCVASLPERATRCSRPASFCAHGQDESSRATGPSSTPSCLARTAPPSVVPPAARGRRSSFCARGQDESSRATGPSSTPSCPARTPPPCARAAKPPARYLQAGARALRSPCRPSYTPTFGCIQRRYRMVLRDGAPPLASKEQLRDKLERREP
ncbi:uncharacterized protein [Dermacentor albipictus]|uniref:uncharacterized protein n=1 Tax=Dermacentor albipictus TaxID=60249 RepID=UPI0038FC5A81